MESSLESRLWLAVHLLYSNASQAFDVYQAVVLQSEQALQQQDTRAIYTKLIQVYEKIPAISTQMAFYEFEFEEIDQWKVIYKNSQKSQLIIFIGILIFEMKISDIAPLVKLAPEKAQFLFHQIFKKLASTSQKLKYNESIEFKKQNDNKISYLFTYENLVDFCLGQLTPEETEKVSIGLRLYPTLQIAREEYARIITQIQNLKVQKVNNTVITDSQRPQLKAVVEGEASKTSPSPTPKKINQHVWSVAGALVVAVIAGTIFLQPRGISQLLGQNHTVVLHEVNKQSSTPAPEPVKVAAETSAPETTTESAVEPVVDSTPVATNETPASAPVSPPTPATEPTPVASPPPPVKADDSAVAEGGLYRGTLMVKDLARANDAIKNKIAEFGAVKAGEVELGWMKSSNMAYYHYTIPEVNIKEVEAYFKKTGKLFIKFEKHPRLVPAGSRRFIIEVKQN